MKTIWKIQPSRRGYAGFTLIELLIVIAIIAILAALTMGAFRYAQESAARNRTTAALTAIKGALERYKEKFGEYPESAETSANDSVADDNGIHLTGAKMLYQAITGDGNDAIKLQNNAPGTIASDGTAEGAELENVIDGSMPKSVKFKSNKGYYFIDGFSRPFQYEKGGSVDAVNPTFDIWSFGNFETQKKSETVGYTAIEKKNPARTGTWIKNW